MQNNRTPNVIESKMGNDASRPLLDIIGAFDPQVSTLPMQQMTLAAPDAVGKLASKQSLNLESMNSGVAVPQCVDEVAAALSARDALDPPSRRARFVTLFRLNKEHPSLTGSKNIANRVVWSVTAGMQERSKFMLPGSAPARVQDILSTPGRNCHVIRFYRGEPFDALQKAAHDPSVDTSQVDLFLAGPGIYAPLLWHDHQNCARLRPARLGAFVAPPAPPPLSAMSTSELLLGLVDVCLGLCYLHQEHPLSPASPTALANLSWLSIFVRTDALGARLPWVLGDVRFARSAAHGDGVSSTAAAASAFSRSPKERDFTAPEVLRNEARGAFGSGDVYSFGRLVESALPPPSGRDADPVVAAARKELERFVAACQQTEAEARPAAADFLKLACVRQCAFARLMRVLDVFFPWAPETSAFLLPGCDGAAAPTPSSATDIDGTNAAEESGAAPSVSTTTVTAATVSSSHEEDEQAELAAAASSAMDQQDSEDDIAAFALDVAFGVSPRQLPSTLLVRVKALFFATLHIECLKIPHELFTRRVVPRLLDHSVFCSGAASPFLWQLLTPVRAGNLAAPDGCESSNPLMIAPPSSGTASAEEAPAPTKLPADGKVQVAPLPVCGLLLPNDLRNIMQAFIESGAALPIFAIEKGEPNMNVMFARPDNARIAAGIAQTRRQHKALLFLRGVDLLIAQSSVDTLASVIAPFVAASLSSPNEYVLRSALHALGSVMLTVVEQKLAMQDRNPNVFRAAPPSSSRRRQHRDPEASDSGDDDDEEEEEADDNGDGDSGDADAQKKQGADSSSSATAAVDPKWFFAVVVTMRALIKVSQIALNETAHHDTQLACFNLCAHAVNIGFAEVQPKLIAVSQRIVGNTSPGAYSAALKIAALEYLYGPIQTLNKQMKLRLQSAASSSSGAAAAAANIGVFDTSFIAEVLPCCLVAAQCVHNSSAVRSLSAKMLCIMVSVCEQQTATPAASLVLPQLQALADRWDAASSILSSVALLGAEAKPLGSNFLTKQPPVGVYTTRSVRGGFQIKLFARNERHAGFVRKLAVMIPADFSLAALAPFRPASASAIAWLSHDADQRLNAAQLLSAAAVSRFFSEREPGEAAPLRPHSLAAKLPSRLVVVAATAVSASDPQQQQAVTSAQSGATTAVAAVAASPSLLTKDAGGRAARRAKDPEVQAGVLEAAGTTGLRKRRAVAAAAAAAAPPPDEPPQEKKVAPTAVVQQPVPAPTPVPAPAVMAPPVSAAPLEPSRPRPPTPPPPPPTLAPVAVVEPAAVVVAEPVAPVSTSSFVLPGARGATKGSSNAVPKRRRVGGDAAVGAPAPAVVPAAMLDAVMDEL